MKHNLKIGVSKNSPKSNVVTYKKVSPDVKVKDLIGESNKVTIIVPGDSVKSVTIEARSSLFLFICKRCFIFNYRC